MTDRHPPVGVRLAALVAALLAFSAYAGWAVPAEAAPGIALPGKPLEGSADAAAPQEVEAGTWTGTVGPGDGGHRFYLYHRVIADSFVHVSVLASRNTKSADDVSLSVTTPAGDDCGQASESAYGPQALAFTASQAVGESVEDLDVSPDEKGACVTSDVLEIEVGRDFGSGTGDLDIALTIIEEAPLSSGAAAAKLPPALDEQPAFQTPDTDPSSSEDRPGGTLAKPEKIASGQQVTAELRSGGAMVYRLDGVTWGQTIDAQVVVNPTPGVSFAELPVTILDPLYARLSTSDANYVSETEKSTSTAVSGPVGYLNRYSSAGLPYLPGSYYVVVALSPMTSPQDVKLTLKVQVRGQESGVPPYDPSAEGPFITTGTSASDTVGIPGAEGGWTLVRGVAVAALAVVGVASLGGGVALLRRR